VVIAAAVVEPASFCLPEATQAKSLPSEKRAPTIVLAIVVLAPRSVSIAPRALPENVSLVSVSPAPALSMPPPKLKAEPLPCRRRHSRM
jgi:hypothetical protein